MNALALRVCLRVLRAARVLVPASRRQEWHEEWEAEIRHRWGRLARRGSVPLAQQVDLVRRTSGSFADAAWLRRQFTADAEIVHDVRESGRLLFRHPRFAVASVVTLALGIGAATTVFSVVSAVLIEPLPFREPDRLAMVWERRHADGREREQAAAATLDDWREQARSFDGLAAWIGWDLALRDGGREPQAVAAARVSPNLFDVLGVAPALGRGFLPGESQPGRERVVVLSHRLWRTRFAANPGVVGRQVALDEEPHVVVGVMPEGFRFPEHDAGLWIPLAYLPHELRSRNQRMFHVLARLAPGASLVQAQAEMDTIASRLAAQHPGAYAGWSVRLEPLDEVARSGARHPLLVLLGAVALVLLIACANVSTLLLARGAARRQELAIRSALGASRGRLLRYLLSEALVLAAAGGVLGLLAARTGVRAVGALGALHLPPWNPVELDGRVIAFAIAVSLTASIACGLLPGLAGGASLPPQAGRGSGGRRATRLSHAIVVAETALSIVLLVGAGLLLRSFARVLQQDPGFRPQGLVSASVFLPDKRYPDDAQQLRFFEELLERVARLPGVVSVGATTTLPMNPVGIDHDMPFAIEGTAAAAATPLPEADFRIVSEDYFRTMGIPVLAGRAFQATDTAQGRRVVIISQRTAERVAPGQDLVGRTLLWGSARRSAEIVGVVGEVRHRGLDAAPRPELYVPFRQLSYGALVVVARVHGDPASLADDLSRQVLALDPALPVSDVSTMDERLSSSLASRRFTLLLLGAFAAFAVVLAATGVYGVVSYTTAQRMPEFGVRLALGARSRDLLLLVLGETAARVAAGVGLGLAGALAAARLLESLLFGISPADPATLASVASMLALVAVGCSLAPARRATRADPVAMLRRS